MPRKSAVGGRSSMAKGKGKQEKPASITAKHPGGRPSSYKPEYCGVVVAAGEQGKSRVWIATKIGVVVQTLDNWSKAHPEFMEALTYAKQLEQMWWEDAGQSNMTKPNFSASAWSRSMAARFPKDWAERKQVDHGVTDALATLLGQIDGNGASLLAGH